MPSRSAALRPASGRTRRWPRISASPRESLLTWVRKDDSQAVPGRRDAAGARRRSWSDCGRRTPGLLKAVKEWQLEREILRQAAAYFAREVK